MSNAGLLPGLNTDTWHRYETELRCAGSGGETQPVLDQSYPFGNPSGRYLIVDHAFVVVAIQANYAGAGYSFGSGDAYVFRLPFPANRWTGPGETAPIPLGVAMAYNSFADPQITLPLPVTLADPFPSLNGQEDWYVQCYCPNIYSWGSGVMVSGGGGITTVTHLLGYTPRPEDIEVIATETGTATSTAGLIGVQNCTATTFDVVTRQNTNTMAFAWKIKGKPPTGSTGPLLSPTKPWAWIRTSPGNFYFGNIFLQFSYEPRR